jgi:hypothetical protein
VNNIFLSTIHWFLGPNRAKLEFKSIQLTLLRARNKIIPSQPHIRTQIIIEGNYLKTINGQNFLIADDGYENKILIFETIEFLRKASDGRKLFMDGTFKSCPKLFHQIYVIHSVEDFGGSPKQMIPLIYILMPDKSKITYKRVFHLLIETGQIFIFFIFSKIPGSKFFN